MSEEDGKQHFYALMNLPGFAINFLPNFIGLLEDWCRWKDFSMHIYCYTFVKEDPQDGDSPLQEIARKMVYEHFPAESIRDTDFVVRHVRNVAPRKEQFCLEIDIPNTILCASTDNEDYVRHEPEVKRQKF